MQTSEIVTQPASEVPLHELVRALNLAYADYYVHISHTVDSFRSLTNREGVLLDASVVAISDQRIIGMGLLAVRQDRGWIGGVGVLSNHRHQGIGRMVMQSLIEQAQHLGLTTLQLEVIRQNTNAYHLYQRLGFGTVRELLVMHRPNSIEPPPLTQNSLALSVRRMPAYAALEALPALIHETRPWQRQISGLRQMVDALEGVGVWDAADQQVGAAVYRAEGGVSIMDLAAASPEAGEAMLVHILNRHKWSDVYYVNVPAQDLIMPALLNHGFQENLGQYEMFLNLTTKDAL